MTDPYRKGAKKIIEQHEYRDGWIVRNWQTGKWEWMKEKLEP